MFSYNPRGQHESGDGIPLVLGNGTSIQSPSETPLVEAKKCGSALTGKTFLKLLLWLWEKNLCGPF